MRQAPTRACHTPCRPPRAAGYFYPASASISLTSAAAAQQPPPRRAQAGPSLAVTQRTTPPGCRPCPSWCPEPRSPSVPGSPSELEPAPPERAERFISGASDSFKCNMTNPFHDRCHQFSTRAPHAARPHRGTLPAVTAWGGTGQPKATPAPLVPSPAPCSPGTRGCRQTAQAQLPDPRLRLMGGCRSPFAAGAASGRPGTDQGGTKARAGAPGPQQGLAQAAPGQQSRAQGLQLPARHLPWAPAAESHGSGEPPAASPAALPHQGAQPCSPALHLPALRPGRKHCSPLLRDPLRVHAHEMLWNRVGAASTRPGAGAGLGPRSELPMQVPLAPRGHGPPALPRAPQHEACGARTRRALGPCRQLGAAAAEPASADTVMAPCLIYQLQDQSGLGPAELTLQPCTNHLQDNGESVQAAKTNSAGGEAEAGSTERHPVNGLPVPQHHPTRPLTPRRPPPAPAFVCHPHASSAAPPGPRCILCPRVSAAQAHAAEGPPLRHLLAGQVLLPAAPTTAPSMPCSTPGPGSLPCASWAAEQPQNWASGSRMAGPPQGSKLQVGLRAVAMPPPAAWRG